MAKRTKRYTSDNENSHDNYDDIIDSTADNSDNRWGVKSTRAGDFSAQNQSRQKLRDICNDSLAGTQEPPTED